MNNITYQKLKAQISIDGKATQVQKDYINVLTSKLGRSDYEVDNLSIDEALDIIKKLKNKLRENDKRERV